jgi:hypothetical protein
MHDAKRQGKRWNPHRFFEQIEIPDFPYFSELDSRAPLRATSPFNWLTRLMPGLARCCFLHSAIMSAPRNSVLRHIVKISCWARGIVAVLAP